MYGRSLLSTACLFHGTRKSLSLYSWEEEEDEEKGRGSELERSELKMKLSIDIIKGRKLTLVLGERKAMRLLNS